MTMNETIQTIEANDTMSQQNVTVEIALTDIKKNDDVFRCRMKEDEATVKKLTKIYNDYKKSVAKGEVCDYPFQPIQVWRHKEQHILLGGYHRLEAAGRAGLTTIQAKVFDGSEDDAFVMALKDNSKHGLRLKQGDMKMCIRKAIERFPEKSLGVIAREVGCVRSYAYRVKDELDKKNKQESEGTLEQPIENETPASNGIEELDIELMNEALDRLDKTLESLSCEARTVFFDKINKWHSDNQQTH